MDDILVPPQLKTVIENGVVCTVWETWRYVFVVAFSEDARALACLALHLEQRDYSVVVGFDTVKRVYFVEAEKRVSVCAAS